MKRYGGPCGKRTSGVFDARANGNQPALAVNEKVDDYVVDCERGRGGGVSEEAAATTSVHDKPRRRGALLHVHGRHCAWCSGRISEPYN